MFLRAAAIAVVTVLGCTRSDEAPKTGKKAEPSVAHQVVDGVTGRASVQSYLNTKETIKEIEKKQKERYEKVP